MLDTSFAAPYLIILEVPIPVPTHRLNDLYIDSLIRS